MTGGREPVAGRTAGRGRGPEANRELRAYSLHLLVFVLANAAFFVLDFFGDPPPAPRIEWADWVLLGWGLGLVLHTISAYAGIVGRDWERRKLDELESRAPRPDAEPGDGGRG